MSTPSPRAAALLLPCLAALAGAVWYVARLPFWPVLALLAGGALAAGFVGALGAPATAGQPATGRAWAFAMRLTIGLAALAAVLLGLLWASGGFAPVS